MGKFTVSNERKNSEMNKKVIYQMFFRTFTNKGTIAAAIEKLDFVASIGVDIVYLCPFVEADDDPNTQYWSPRQIKSGIPNPKNTYRISDYFKIDEEYGTDEDFKCFVEKAHSLGLKVMVDLVYMHCGPGKFADKHPEFLKHKEDGSIVYNGYHFPDLNFDNPALCEYLWDNMLYWIRDFDVDGFRTDVGDAVPLFFWAEGRKRIDAIKPGCIMLNEGERPEYLTEVFDANYSFTWSKALKEAVLKKHNPHSIRLAYEGAKALNPDGAVVLRAYENHDISTDSFDKRIDKVNPSAGDALAVLNFLVDGIPFIYNGNEIADGGRHSIWNRPCDGFCIDWSGLESEKAQKRLKLTRELCRMKHEMPILSEGNCEIEKDDKLLKLYRKLDGSQINAYFNFTEEPVRQHIACGTPLLSGLCEHEDDEITLAPLGGYFVEEV